LLALKAETQNICTLLSSLNAVRCCDASVLINYHGQCRHHRHPRKRRRQYRVSGPLPTKLTRSNIFYLEYLVLFMQFFCKIWPKIGSLSVMVSNRFSRDSGAARVVINVSLAPTRAIRERDIKSWTESWLLARAFPPPSQTCGSLAL
jgi:hypothetical protein